jgi:putative protease
MQATQEVGKVTHFYPKIHVAVVELELPLSVGDRIHIDGRTTHMEEVVESMEIEHKAITRADPGQSVGLKVCGRVRESDVVSR